MGRGYSANRGTSQRPASKQKRTRSLSLSRLKSRVGEIATSAKTKEEIAQAIKHIDSDEELYASEDDDESIRRQAVLTKYKICGTVTDRAIEHVVALCITGARTIDLCAAGDAFVEETLKKMFRKSKSENGLSMKRGLCFPTTVCVNNVLCHHKPFSDKDSVTLRNGDVVKVSVAAHVDGYPTTATRTIVVGLEAGEVSVDRPTAHALMASYNAMQGMIRLMRPGMKNQDITDYIAHVAKVYDVQTVEAVLSNRTKRWILDGMQCIIARRVLTEDPQQNVEDCDIGESQVWSLDVAFTTSASYRMKYIDNETNIFRRNEVPVNPRHPASEAVVKEIFENSMCFPFSPSRTANPLRTRLGLVELRKFDALDAFPVLGSTKGTITTRASCTVAVTEKRVNVLSGLPPALPAAVTSVVEAKETPEMAELLAEPITTGKPMKKGSTDVAAHATEDADDDAENNAAGEGPAPRKAHRSGR